MLRAKRVSYDLGCMWHAQMSYKLPERRNSCISVTFWHEVLERVT